jgi:hypothetical protein
MGAVEKPVAKGTHELALAIELDHGISPTVENPDVSVRVRCNSSSFLEIPAWG